MSNAYAIAVCQAHPFIKWAGGKGKMLTHLQPFVPATFGRYHEPFVGGAAMFYALQPARAVVGDTNPELVNAYTVVRDSVGGLIVELHQHFYDKDHFYEVRALDPRTLSPTARAARFIFLNRTCFNGLHRVNRRGQFNVPFGQYTNPVICDAANLRACSAALQSVDLNEEPFERVLDRAVAGDFVYFDPPYLPISATSSFTAYTADGFGLTDHRRLRDVAAILKARGVSVLISNSAAPAIRALYADGFEVTQVLAARAINSKAGGRGAVTELMIR